MVTCGTKPDSTERFQRMVEKLKEHGLRMTPQRLVIVQALVATEAHPSVEDIHTQVSHTFPTTSLATVYKTVSLLKELNEVLELGFPNMSNRYDGLKPYPHPHVICLQCKKIMDPELVSMADLAEEMSKKTGFVIVSHRLDFFGICPECQQREGD